MSGGWVQELKRKKGRKFTSCGKRGLSLLLRDSRYIGKKPVKNCLNARAKMTSDKFDDERLLARKTNENKMKNG